MTESLRQRPSRQVDDDALLTLALSCPFIGGLEFWITWPAWKPNFGHSLAAVTIDELTAF
ncbi:hypothetical protein [Mesorhizobium sp. M1329]|uniref:hypothetical protein n=1 Tax=Mesorhizobium sp. M1329 TaxID=2957083 RepID=UPI003335B82D